MKCIEYTVYLKNKQVLEKCVITGTQFNPNNEEEISLYGKIKDKSDYEQFLMWKKYDIPNETVYIKFSQHERIRKQEHKDYKVDINEIEKIN